MIDKYYRFDVDGFFREYKSNTQRLKDVIYEIQCASDISGVSYGGEEKSCTNLPSDPTANKVKKRMTLEERKADLEEYFRLYDRIMNKLDANDKVYVELYLKRECSKDKAADDVMNKLCIERTSFYNGLSQLRKTISEIADYL